MHYVVPTQYIQIQLIFMAAQFNKIEIFPCESFYTQPDSFETLGSPPDFRVRFRREFKQCLAAQHIVSRNGSPAGTEED